MVQIPFDPVSSVSVAPTPTPYAPELRQNILEEAAGEGTARSVGNIGTALDQIDQADGKAQALAISTKLNLDQQSAFQNAANTAQPGAPGFTQNFMQQHDQAWADATAGVNNKYALSALGTAYNNSSTKFMENAQNFQAQQQVALRVSNINSSVQNIASSFGNMAPGDVNDSYNNQADSVDSVIDASMMTPSQKDALKTQSRNTLAYAATLTAIKANPTSFLQTVTAPTAGLGGDADPSSGAQTLDEDGMPMSNPKVTGIKGFDDLDYSGQQRMIQEAQKEAQKNQVGLRNDLNQQISDQNSMAVNGTPNPNPVRREQVYAAYDSDTAATEWSKVQQEARSNADLFTVSTNSPDQNAQLLAKNAPVAGNGYGAQNDIYVGLQKAVSLANTARAKDPMQMSMNTGQLDQSDDLDFTSKDFPQQLRERQNAALTNNKTYGVAPLPFTGNEAKGIGQAMDQMGVQQKMQILGAMSDNLDDPKVFRAAMQQIRPDSPVTAMAASYLNADNSLKNTSGIFGQTSTLVPGSVVMDHLLRGEELLNPTTASKKEDGIGKQYVMPADSKGLQNDIDNVTGQNGTNGLYLGQPELAAQDKQAIRAYYAAAASDKGYSGDYNPTIGKEAIRNVLGDVANINGKQVSPPWGMDQSTFTDAAKANYTTFIAPTQASAPKWSDVQFQNTDTPGQYFIRSGTGFLDDGKGNHIVMDITKELPKVAPESPQPADFGDR